MDDLYHSFKLSKKKTDWKKHKYYAKVQISPKVARYFYTQAEYQTYMKGKQPKIQEQKETRTFKFPGYLERGAKALELLFNKPIKKPNDTKSLVAKGKAQADKSLTKIGGIKMSEIKTKIEAAFDKVKKFVSKVIDSTVGKIFSKDLKDQSEQKPKKNGIIPDRDSSDKHFNDEFNSNAKKAEDVQKDINQVKYLKEKTYDCSEDDDMNLVNPFYEYPPGYYDYAFSNNCASCSLAYELRRRGYDVEAGAMVSDGPTLDSIKDMYGLEKDDIYACEQIDMLNYAEKSRELEQDILNRHGNNSRGQFCVYWHLGGAHSVVWECKNDKVIVRDCQDNKTYNIEDLAYMAKAIVSYRTDNIDISDIKLDTDEFYIINRED